MVIYVNYIQIKANQVIFKDISTITSSIIPRSLINTFITTVDKLLSYNKTTYTNGYVFDNKHHYYVRVPIEYSTKGEFEYGVPIRYYDRVAVPDKVVYLVNEIWDHIPNILDKPTILNEFIVNGQKCKNFKLNEYHEVTEPSEVEVKFINFVCENYNDIITDDIEKHTSVIRQYLIEQISKDMLSMSVRDIINSRLQRKDNYYFINTIIKHKRKISTDDIICIFKNIPYIRPDKQEPLKIIVPPDTIIFFDQCLDIKEPSVKMDGDLIDNGIIQFLNDTCGSMKNQDVNICVHVTYNMINKLEEFVGSPIFGKISWFVDDLLKCYNNKVIREPWISFIKSIIKPHNYQTVFKWIIEESHRDTKYIAGLLTVYEGFNQYHDNKQLRIVYPEIYENLHK